MDVDIKIKVVPLVSELKPLGMVELSLKKFSVEFSSNEKGEVTKLVSGVFVINKKHRVHITDKERIEICYKGVPISIIPILTKHHGFILEIKIANDAVEEHSIILGEALRIIVTA